MRPRVSLKRWTFSVISRTVSWVPSATVRRLRAPTWRSVRAPRPASRCWQVRAWSSQVSGGGRRRKDDGEGGAGTLGAVDQQLAVVRLDDAVGNRQPQPDSRGRVLGGEERIEDPIAHRLGN